MCIYVYILLYTIIYTIIVCLNGINMAVFIVKGGKELDN